MRKILAKLKHAWFLALLFLPQWAFAADNNILPVIPPPTSGFSPTPGDWSVTFLRQIFGQVGNGSVLSGAPQTIIGKLFGVFNSAMLVLISVVVIYIIIKTIMDIASFGEIIGRKISHWTAVRTAFGIGLLVPTASGYSYIQIIIMWAVMQGIGLADTAWTTAVNYLKQGGVIYTTPAETNTVDKLQLPLVDSVVSLAPGDADPSKVGAGDVLASLACMHVIEHAINNKNAAQKQYYLNHPENAPKDQSELLNVDNKVTLQPRYDIQNHQVFFPGISTDDPNSGFDGVCGVYNWNTSDFIYTHTVHKTYYDKHNNPVPADSKKAKPWRWVYDINKTAPDSQVKDNYLEAKESGIKQMVLTLDPLAQNIVNQKYRDIDDNTNTDVDYNFASSYIVNAASDYQTIIYPVALYAASLMEKGRSTADKVIVDYGWAAAGSYYAQISGNVVLPKLDNSYNQSNYRINIDKTYSPTSQLPDQERQTALQQVEQKLDNYSNTIIDKEVLEQAIAQIDNVRVSAMQAAEQKNDAIRNSDVDTNIPDLSKSAFFKNKNNFSLNVYNKKGKEKKGDISFHILKKGVANIVGKWRNYMIPNGNNNTAYNLPPITKLQQIGDAMTAGAADIWVKIYNRFITWRISTMAAISAAGIAASTGAFLSSTFLGLGAGGWSLVGSTLIAIANSLSGMINAALFMSLPMVLAVTGPIFTTGAILSIYVPLIPFMLFTFGIISWIIFVIEAMAAAPLVALGITHPEGHDLMGKAEQALMLWLSVFLRPIAMIIGLIGGMVLIHIAVTVLNAGFGGIVDTLFLSSDKTGVSSFKGIMVMLVYTFIVVALVNQCFGLIHVIPEKIMRWIGLSPDHSEAPQLMESVKGGVTPFAEATGSGAGRVAGESSRAVGDSAGGLGQVGGKYAGKAINKGAERYRGNKDVSVNPANPHQ